MDNLLKSMRRTGLLIVIGLCVIIYVGLGFTYAQQGMKQGGLDEGIKQLSIWVATPTPQAGDLQAEYDKATRALAPMATQDVIEMIVSIAGERGIDLRPDGGKFNIPSPGSPVMRKVGDTEYQVLPIKGIKVEGEYSAVMSVISELGSGKRLETMTLESVDIKWLKTDTTGKKEPDKKAPVNITATLDVSLYTKPVGEEKKLDNEKKGSS
ncbi:hypothetical protein ACFLV4_04265 [Chloroflexota bacterium]